MINIILGFAAAITPQHQFIIQNYQSAVKIERVYNIPRYIILSQAALESGWGTSDLARDANNLFGIKWWRGCGYDFHIMDGGKVRWRCYSSKSASLCDYAEFMDTQTTIPNIPKDKPDEWARWVRRTGYAGKDNTGYERNILQIINKYFT